MRTKPPLSAWSLPVVFLALLLTPVARGAEAKVSPAPVGAIAVGPQYDSTHVYLAASDLDDFTRTFLALFGGKVSDPVVMNVLPVPSTTEAEFLTSPVGLLSLFAFQTPVPYPFGLERTGYLVTDLDRALKAARAAGAEVIVEPFKDPIGRDAVIQWPGGVKMQLYWHFTAPHYEPLASIPENRVYLSRDRADNFVRDFLQFSGGKVLTDDKAADAGEIGRLGETYRRISLTSLFGNMLVLVTDGHLPYPFGRETTGYEVSDLDATLTKAKAVGANVVSGPHRSHDRATAVVGFPGGYIAEVHCFVAH